MSRKRHGHTFLGKKAEILSLCYDLAFIVNRKMGFISCGKVMIEFQF